MNAVRALSTASWDNSMVQCWGRLVDSDWIFKRRPLCSTLIEFAWKPFNSGHHPAVTNSARLSKKLMRLRARCNRTWTKSSTINKMWTRWRRNLRTSNRRLLKCDPRLASSRLRLVNVVAASWWWLDAPLPSFSSSFSWLSSAQKTIEAICVPDILWNCWLTF